MGLTQEEASRIVASGSPILCFDTCSILDVMRDPTRESLNPLEIMAALDLLNKMEEGVELIGLIATQVRFELSEHLNRVEDEARDSIIKWQNRTQKINAVSVALGATETTNLSHLDSHVARARAVVDRIIQAGKLFAQPLHVTEKAFARLNQARTPAKKGKDSMKDCVVIETYLSVVDTLRSSGLKSKIVFISSNTKDYAGDTGSKLKLDLASEFASRNMEYAPNMGAAKFFLGF
ncbi:hypothetical protein UNDKW_1271 [Undibacterium sp. KW1]|uniref:PIN domain-containing protein n=1 Tax=Undibacterium sp. KW1 TaxID=2058624 RepID=UPI001331E829|nr:PIN domain-containing protein [Undibacterium sp. KW1]BBB59544.1 hypothetical protein UNDKW_1271 [Undibacterium sp. KW1]